MTGVWHSHAHSHSPGSSADPKQTRRQRSYSSRNFGREAPRSPSVITRPFPFPVPVPVPRLHQNNSPSTSTCKSESASPPHPICTYSITLTNNFFISTSLLDHPPQPHTLLPSTIPSGPPLVRAGSCSARDRQCKHAAKRDTPTLFSTSLDSMLITVGTSRSLGFPLPTFRESVFHGSGRVKSWDERCVREHNHEWSTRILWTALSGHGHAVHAHGRLHSGSQLGRC